MNTASDEYEFLVKEFCLRTIQNTYYVLKLVKGCGYSEILIVPKYYQVHDLLKLIVSQFGTWMISTVYFINKNNEKIFINNLPPDMLVKDLWYNLKWAYSVEDCIHNVRLLYYGTCGCGCGCIENKQCDECA